MTIRFDTQYPGKVNPSSSDYPFGSARNVTSAGANDGTPLDQAWVNDLQGFIQALFNATGITPNGTPDTATNSQIFGALSLLISQVYTFPVISCQQEEIESVANFITQYPYSASIGMRWYVQVREASGENNAYGSCVVTYASAEYGLQLSDITQVGLVLSTTGKLPNPSVNVTLAAGQGIKGMVATATRL